MSSTFCAEQNSTAAEQGLVRPEVAEKATEEGVCIVNAPGIPTILAVCPVGCFEANTKILVENDDGTTNERPASQIGMSDRLAALDKNSDLYEPNLISKPLSLVTAGPEEYDLFRFKLSNGRALSVTQYHGMVLSDGRVVFAQDVKLDDAFVSSNGQEVEIVSIDRISTDLNVHNFKLDVDTPEEHVIVAEDVLIGDLYWQAPRSIENYSKMRR